MAEEKTTFQELKKKYPFTLDGVANSAFVSRQAVVDMSDGKPVHRWQAEKILEALTENLHSGVAYNLDNVDVKLLQEDGKS